MEGGRFRVAPIAARTVLGDVSGPTPSGSAVKPFRTTAAWTEASVAEGYRLFNIDRGWHANRLITPTAGSARFADREESIGRWHSHQG